MSEENEGLSACAWIGTMGHRPRARCQLLGTNVCTFPKPGVWGVYMSIHRQIPSWTSQEAGSPRSGQRYQAGGGSLMVFWGTHEFGVSMGQVCECCLNAASTQLGQWVGNPWGR